VAVNQAGRQHVAKNGAQGVVVEIWEQFRIGLAVGGKDLQTFPLEGIEITELHNISRRRLSFKA
jgi:hypothetical protein